jgi:hypothetical protein
VSLTWVELSTFAPPTGDVEARAGAEATRVTVSSNSAAALPTFHVVGCFMTLDLVP